MHGQGEEQKLLLAVYRPGPLRRRSWAALPAKHTVPYSRRVAHPARGGFFVETVQTHSQHLKFWRNHQPPDLIGHVEIYFFRLAAHFACLLRCGSRPWERPEYSVACLSGHAIIVVMNKLSTDKRCAVVAALVEGNSIRATARMTDVSKPTILKLIADLGPVCADYQDAALTDLGCRRLECDEIWQFVYAKQKNVEKATRAPQEAGDVWTWVAIDADSKLIPTWQIGPRDAITAHAFMTDLAGRLKHRIQLTTDGLQAYVEAVEDAFGMDIDYAQLIKVYGADAERRAALQPGRVPELQRAGDPGGAGPEADLDKLHRTPEPDDADVDATLHAP